MAKRVFGVDVQEGFIKLQNRSRKVRDQIRQERKDTEAAIAAREAAIKAETERAENVVQSVRWVAELWGAASKRDAQGQLLRDDRGQPVIDFDAADEAFRANMGGISFDDYARMRARRGVANPQVAQERAARIRAERELERLKGPQAQTTNGAGSGAETVSGKPAGGAAPAPAEPAEDPAQLWGDELPADHPLRQFSGWEKDLHREMRSRYYDADLDEYSRDPEEVAGELLRARLAALQPEPPAAPQRQRPAAAGRPNTPKRRRETESPGGIPSASQLTPRASAAGSSRRSDHREISVEEARAALTAEVPKDYKARERWALERAQRRLRGESVD